MSRIAWIRLAVLVALVALLEILVRTGRIPYKTMLPPSEMATALARLLVSGTANRDIVQTLTCVAAALTSSVVGLRLGVASPLPALPPAPLFEPFFAPTTRCRSHFYPC